MSHRRKNLPPRKFNFWDKVQTPNGKGEISGIYLREEGWMYTIEPVCPAKNTPKNWWREEVLSPIESNIES